MFAWSVRNISVALVFPYLYNHTFNVMDFYQAIINAVETGADNSKTITISCGRVNRMATVSNIIIVFCDIASTSNINKIITTLTSLEISLPFSFTFYVQPVLTTLSFMPSRLESPDLQVICALLLLYSEFFIF